MKIDVENLKFVGVDRYYADGARALITEALVNDPKDTLELTKLILELRPEDRLDPELRYLKHLAINALSRSEIR